MPEESSGIKLTGGKALIALALVAAWFGFRIYMNFQPVTQEERDAIAVYLTDRYQGNSPTDILRRAQQAKDGQPVDPTPPPDSMHLNIDSASARGGNNHLIVRVELSVNGGIPPDGRSVRFLSLSHQQEKWAVLWDSTSYQYFEALWK